MFPSLWWALALAAFCGLLIYILIRIDPFDAIFNWWESREQRDRDLWHCVAYGGGASVWIGPKTRDEAVSYCTSNFGTVAYVDDERKHIFYKPPGWTGSAYPGQLGM